MLETNNDLKQDLSANLEEIELEKATRPFMSESLASMTLALDDADVLKEAISAQNDEYHDLTEKLTQENNLLKQQNSKYQERLENMKNENQKRELEHQHKIEALEAKIEKLENENDALEETTKELEVEMEEFKEEMNEELKEQMEAASPAPDVGEVIENQKALKINFVQSNIMPNGSVPLESLRSMMQLATAKKSQQLTLPMDKYSSYESDDDGGHQRNISYYMRKYVSNPKLQFVDYESARSIPGLDDYISDDVASIPSIQPQEIGIPQDRVSVINDNVGTGDEKINEERQIEMIKKQNQEFEAWIDRLLGQVQEKDKEIADMILQYEDVMNDVQKLKGRIGELKDKNRLLTSDKKNKEKQGCFVFDFFG